MTPDDAPPRRGSSTSTEGLRELKRRLSPRLLQIDGVSGVGIPGGKLTVYLAKDTENVRHDVAALLATEGPGVAVDYVVTGVFRPQ